MAAALIAGLLGGFGGAYALRYVDALQGPDPADRAAELSARTDALERKTEASTAAVAALEGRVAAVESGAAKSAASTDTALSQLRAAVASHPAAAAGYGEPLDLGPIEEKVSALEKKLGALDAVQQKAGEIDAVQQKLGAIEAALAAPKTDVKAEQERALADQHAKESRGGPFEGRRRDQPRAARQPRRTLLH